MMLSIPLHSSSPGGSGAAMLPPSCRHHPPTNSLETIGAACAVPVARSSAAILVKNNFMRRGPSREVVLPHQVIADQMTHEEARTIMRRIANDYDRLAKLAEAQLADQERGANGD